MKTNVTIILCTLLLCPYGTFAQRTEIDVHHGIVRAKLDNKSLDIEAGRKITLLLNGQPTLGVSNPLVDETLTLVKLIEREKQSSDLKIDSVLAMTIDMTISDTESSTAAIYAELPNFYKTRIESVTLGNIVRVDNFAVYDTDGKRLKVDVRPTDTPDHANYKVHFKTPCEADELMKFVVVATLDKIPYRPGGSDGVWKKGPLCYFFTEFSLPNSLHYYRVILPESAIFVDSTIPPLVTDTHYGRTAVTLRQYTGPHYDSKFTLAFLYPKQDQTTLADLPSPYLDLGSETEHDYRATFQVERNQIKRGKRYHKQNTPIDTLLSLYSATYNNDKTAYCKVRDSKTELDFKNDRYWFGVYTDFSMQPWPQNPGNGYIHPIYLCRAGTKLPELKLPMIYRDKKWFARPAISYISNMAHEGSVTPTEAPLLKKLKAQGFITDWQVTGPYAQANTEAKDLFNMPFGPELDNVDTSWRPIPIDIFKLYDQDLAHVNLHKYLDGGPHRVAYLRTIIHADHAVTERLDVRSDDSVKVWLNNTLIHSNSSHRGVDVGPDVISITLKPGENELIFKVTQSLFGWGLIVQLGSQKAVSPQPTGHAWNPNIPIQLKWTPATTAQSHRVYLGTNRASLPFHQEVNKVADLPPLSLDPGKHYYWRVDEVLADGTIIKGDTWDFATGKQIAWWSFDKSLNNRIADTLHSTANGTVQWGKGVQKQALILKSREDYVTIPPMHLNTDTLTVTMWIKTSEIVQNPGLFFSREGSTCAGLWLGQKNDLRYNWNDDMSTWAWDSNLIVPHQQWTYVAMVVDMFKAQLYLHDGTEMKSALHDHGHGKAQFDGDTWIGHDPRWSTFKGAIDDVSVFTYALLPDEIEAIHKEAASTH